MMIELVYDEQKLNAISYYKSQRGESSPTIQEMCKSSVQATLDKAFVKYVPKSVRLFLEKKEGEY